jgi:8-oxo-dGTP pyrophosphatase MutT (NUDIX family)
MPVEEVEEFLRSRADWLGASCVARYRDEEFLFAAAVRDTVLELSGIGGKVESGESFRDAALREFEEETGTRPDVLVGVERPRTSPSRPVMCPYRKARRACGRVCRDPPGGDALVDRGVPGVAVGGPAAGREGQTLCGGTPAGIRHGPTRRCAGSGGSGGPA